MLHWSIYDLTALMTQLSNEPFESFIMTYLTNQLFESFVTYSSQLYKGDILYRWNWSVVFVTLLLSGSSSEVMLTIDGDGLIKLLLTIFPLASFNN